MGTLIAARLVILKSDHKLVTEEVAVKIRAFCEFTHIQLRRYIMQTETDSGPPDPVSTRSRLIHAS